jgi:urease accessory protein UreF
MRLGLLLATLREKLVKNDLVLPQYGDSFFPSGTASFSWGLETLAEDGQVHSVGGFSDFLVKQLRYRWATSFRASATALWASMP